jgi:hypothetical protein
MNLLSSLNTRGTRRSIGVIAVLVALLVAANTFAQGGSGYSIGRYTVDNGGGTSTGGNYTLSGSIGQPEAHNVSATGGSYTLRGGFWVIPVIGVPITPVDLYSTGFTPPYTWTGVAGGTNYTILVFDLATNTLAASESFTSAACNATTLACSGAGTTALANNKSYGWYVAAFVGGAWQPFSNSIVFLLSVPPTAAPTLISPVGFLTAGTPLTPTFSFTTVAGATNYAVVLYNLSNNSLAAFETFSTSICTGSTCSTTLTGITLTNGVPYGWFAAAYNYGGPGPWSVGLPFIPYVVPAPPTLVSPSGAATSPVTFTWNPALGATHYYMVILNSSAQQVYGQWHTASTACTAQCVVSGVNLANGSYTWLVASNNAAGTSAYSAGMVFTIGGGSAPIAPTFQP